MCNLHKNMNIQPATCIKYFDIYHLPRGHNDVADHMQFRRNKYNEETTVLSSKFKEDSAQRRFNPLKCFYNSVENMTFYFDQKLFF